jgi:hypothetical protein
MLSSGRGVYQYGCLGAMSECLIEACTLNYWVILLLFVILAPMVWLVPSRRQQGQITVRLQARRLGLGMQLSPQQWPHWIAETAPDPCPQYYRARREGSAGEWCYWRAASGEWQDRWREPCQDPGIAEALEQLPGDTYKFEASDRVIAVCWGERGGEEALSALVSVIERLA